MRHLLPEPWTVIQSIYRQCLLRSNQHKGASFLKYIRTVTFLMMLLLRFLPKKSKADRNIIPGAGQTILFGANKDKGIKLDGFTPVSC